MKRFLLTALVAGLIPLASASAFQILTPEQMEEGASFDGKYFQNYGKEADDPRFSFEVGGGDRALPYDHRADYYSGLRGGDRYNRRGGAFGSSQQYCSSGSSAASMTALSYGVVDSYPCQRFR